MCDLKRVTYGSTGGILMTEKDTIVKLPFPGHVPDLHCEQQAYEMLGPHPRIARCYGRFNEGRMRARIILEGLHRQAYDDNAGRTIISQMGRTNR